MPKPLPLLTDAGPVCCAPLGSSDSRLTIEAATEVAVRLKALADPVRLRLVDHLAARPGLEDSASSLSAVVGLADSTTNHHLKQLLNAGVVSKRRDGMNVHYRLTPASLSAIAGVLNATCC
ncbi:metalloregulator ArsR/SmtB family transcription factor [Nocardioidaceae bacterium SCSIO 66511]|nr:metalloregulator ArsR/SmtB family transcription factor [Nocardioidaceae bacterium SCSIO 66511]